jgi:kynureninase
LIAALDDRTACVLVSSVLFSTAEIVPGLDRVQAACDRHGATLLIDAYHHLNAVPFDIRTLGVGNAFITGGGYKYCQLGEGNCFLRVPEGCRLRPVLTGWFAEFDALEQTSGGGVAYAPGAGAFAGATYDPTSHYRAAAVFAFHRDQGLNPEELRRISCQQVHLLKTAFEALDISPRVAAVEQMPDERRAGFLAIRAPGAVELARTVRRRGLFVDARGDVLRLGPAPYLGDEQLRDAVATLGEQLRSPA